MSLNTRCSSKPRGGRWAADKQRSHQRLGLQRVDNRSDSLHRTIMQRLWAPSVDAIQHRWCRTDVEISCQTQISCFL